MNITEISQSLRCVLLSDPNKSQAKQVSYETIEKVALKAISNHNYELARELGKICKNPVSRVFILDSANKYEKNPRPFKVTRPPERMKTKSIDVSLYTDGIPITINKEEEANSKTINAFMNRFSHKTHQEMERARKKSELDDSRLRQDAPQKFRQKIRRNIDGGFKL